MQEEPPVPSFSRSAMSAQQWLQLEYRAQQREMDLRIQTILARGQFLHGPEVGQLEGQLARCCGVEYAVTCASGSDALVLGLGALGVGRGDRVYTPAFGFVAGAEAIVRVGATPVFVDVEPVTFNIDPRALRAALTQRSTVRGGEVGKNADRAVLALDLFGVPANYAALEPICEEFGLKLIEDAAQAWGATHQQRAAGGFGSLATLSFFPTKPLGAFGDGGAVLTRNAEIAESVRALKAHGWGVDRHDSQRIGMNSRLDTLQAGILLEKLKVFQQARRSRQAIAEMYSQALPAGFTAPMMGSNWQPAWAHYCLVAPDEKARQGLMNTMRDNGINVVVYYPKPLPQQLAYRDYCPTGVRFPVSEELSKRILALPLHAHIPQDQVNSVLLCLRKQ